jgi:hypothetical protein
MNRRDLGFVVSRALSVMVWLQVIRHFEFIAEGIASNREYPSANISSHIAIAITISVVLAGLGLLLWLKAESFGGRPAAELPTPAMAHVEFRKAILYAVGVYVSHLDDGESRSMRLGSRRKEKRKWVSPRRTSFRCRSQWPAIGTSAYVR